MVASVFVVFAALTLWDPARPPVVPKHAPAPAATARARFPATEELYALRARRRIAAYLRLRLLEWREEGLERAAAVVERRLSVDALIPDR